MRVVILSAEEAADPLVMKNLRQYILESEDAGAKVFTAPKPPAIDTTAPPAVALAPSPVEHAFAAAMAAQRGELPPLPPPAIAPEDDPSVGSQHATPLPALDLSAIFGGAGKQQAVPAAPPPPVPSVAVAAPSSTAPVAPPASSAPSTSPAPVAPAVSAATVPAASATPTGFAQSAELDSEGVPWDSRIHSSSKNKVEGGRWRAKRGVDDAFANQIKADLRRAMNAPGVVPVQQPAAPTPPTGAPPVPAPTGASLATALSSELMPYVMQRKISGNDIQAACVECGLTGFTDLNNRPDLIPVVRQKLFAAMGIAT